MNFSTINIKWLAISLIVFAVISRLIPHEYNFAPFGAIALFSSAYFANKSTSIFITFLATWISGVILNNFVYSGTYNHFVIIDENLFWQSLSYILIILLGKIIFASGVKWYKVVGGAIVSSIIFFIVTNFGFWLSGLAHPLNLDGLLLCYRDAIPFFRGTFYGDLIYSVALFGVYYLMSQVTLKPSKSAA